MASRQANKKRSRSDRFDGQRAARDGVSNLPGNRDFSFIRGSKATIDPSILHAQSSEVRKRRQGRTRDG